MSPITLTDDLMNDVGKFSKTLTIDDTRVRMTKLEPQSPATVFVVRVASL